MKAARALRLGAWAVVVVAATATRLPAQGPAPAATTAAAAAANAGLRDALPAGFERRLAAIAEGLDGVLGYAIVDLAEGERLTRLSSVPSATTRR